jgi:hypothetical protein
MEQNSHIVDLQYKNIYGNNAVDSSNLSAYLVLLLCFLY